MNTEYLIIICLGLLTLCVIWLEYRLNKLNKTLNLFNDEKI